MSDKIHCCLYGDVGLDNKTFPLLFHWHNFFIVMTNFYPSPPPLGFCLHQTKNINHPVALYNAAANFSPRTDNPDRD